jgi:hypothetical protein
VATRRQLQGLPEAPPQQWWGSRLYFVGIIALALILVVAVVFCALGANDQLPKVPDETGIDLTIIPALPQDLAVLAMLAAIGLVSWDGSPNKRTPLRQRIYAIFAVTGSLIGIILIWANQMVIEVLVYIAVSGVEMADSPRFLPPEMNVSSAVRIQRFTGASLAGLLLVIANLLLITALTKWWNKPRLRWPLIVVLALGLVVQSEVVWWIAVQGIRQLSPPFQGTMVLPSWNCFVVVGLMILLAVAVFSWRILAKPTPTIYSLQAPKRKLFFHERWSGCLSLGLVALIWVAYSIVHYIRIAHNLSFSDCWQMVAYGFTYPEQSIWLAAAVGGLALAWARFRNWARPVTNVLPSINPLQFAVTMVSLTIIVVTGAAILAAASFSFWLV